MVKKPKQTNNYKHLKNFVGLPSREVLTGFHYRSDGSVEATNSHILMRLLHMTSGGIDLVINPQTLETIPRTYPDTDRLIPKQHRTTFKLSGNQCQDLFDYTKQFKQNKGAEALEMKYDENGLKLRAGNGLKLVIEDIALNGDPGQILVQARYLKIVTDFLRDNIPDNLTVTWKLGSPLHPILISNDVSFEILLTPMRPPNRHGE